MDKNFPYNKEFSIVKDGIEYKYEMINVIANLDGKNFIVYKDENSNDDSDYVSRFEIVENQIVLYPVKDNEWNMLDEYL